MGYWGLGVFENDDAVDLLSEFEDQKAFSVLVSAVEQVITDDQIEVEDINAAVAAIAARGRGSRRHCSRQDAPDGAVQPRPGAALFPAHGPGKFGQHSLEGLGSYLPPPEGPGVPRGTARRQFPGRPLRHHRPRRREILTGPGGCLRSQ